MHITVLGGAGKMGCIAVQDLVNDRWLEEVVIAGIDTKQGRMVVDYLDSPKLNRRQVDIKDHGEFYLSPGRDGRLPERDSLLY